MDDLRDADLRALLEFLPRIYALSHLDDFPNQSIQALNQLVPADVRAAHRRASADQPLSADRRWAGRQDIGLLSQRQLHDLGLYQDFFAWFPVEFQMAVVLPARSPLVIGIALSRSTTDLSERDRALLDLVRPHLVHAYRNAQLFSRLIDGAETSGLGFLLVGQNGGIDFASGNALDWMEAYFGGDKKPGAEPPGPVASWLQRQRDQLAGRTSIPVPIQPLAADREGRRLLLQFVPGGPSSSGDMVVLEEEVAVCPDVLAGLGLTRREAEVLTLLTDGKTDAEIADLLVLSRRTVQKHVERIRSKLGVENRMAAAARAFEAARGWTG